MTEIKRGGSAFKLKSVAGGFDLDQIREDFPVLRQKPHGRKLVFLDSAASAQKPRAVNDAIRYC